MAVFGADDAGYSHFSADDGCVAGHASVVGYDGCGSFHGWDPVGVGHFGYEYVAVFDVSDVFDFDYDLYGSYAGSGACA